MPGDIRYVVMLYYSAFSRFCGSASMLCPHSSKMGPGYLVPTELLERNFLCNLGKTHVQHSLLEPDVL